MRHREGETELWYGATVPLWALIPRAIWPDKPAVGGGQDLVSEFTGNQVCMKAPVSVSGQVLEFYMNFGMPGVLAGFAVLGFILMRLDQGVMRALAMRNIHGVVKRCSARLGDVGSRWAISWKSSLRWPPQSLRRNFFPLKLLGSPPAQRPNAKYVGTDDAGDRAAMIRRLRVAIATAERFHVLSSRAGAD